MEWMFEFPELIDEKGRFVGFDIIVGNPPYIPLANIKNATQEYGSMKLKEKPIYSTFCKGGDIYTLFVERAYALVGKNGIVSYIMPNKWMTTDYGKGLRKFFLEKVSATHF
jgi:methylase of polypeptide subunit release factors